MLQRSALLCLLLALASLAHAQSSWTVGRTNRSDVTALGTIAFGHGRFLLTVGDTNDGPALVSSTDGETWQPANPPNLFITQRGTIRFLGSSFYLTSGNSLFRSPDGVTWQRVPIDNPPPSLGQIASVDGRALLVTTGGINVPGGLNATTLLYSPDGTTWRRTAALPESQLGRVSQRALATVAGRYFVSYDVMLDNGNLRSFAASTVDGNTWDSHPEIPGATLASGNGRLAAYTGVVRFTTDGRTFTTNLLTGLNPNGGTFGFAGGRFFLLGPLLASVDAVAWAPLATLPATNAYLTDIAYGNGRYVAIGSGNNSAGPRDVVVRLTAAAPPTFSTPPADRTVLVGDALTLSVAMANNDPAMTFQWRRDGQVIAGATAATFTIPRAATTDAGSYTVEARNALGTTLSHAAVVTVSATPPPPPPEPGRIINLSVLTDLEPAEPNFIVGFSVGGEGTSGAKPVLVRVAGPSLAAFGIATASADPRLELYEGIARVAENDNWAGAAAIVDAGGRVGAFPFLGAASRDAAVLGNLARGGNSVHVSGATGAVIAEVYDASPAFTAFTANTPRLINVSVLKRIRSDNPLKAGFVLGGATTRSVLIRVIGPSLALFGLGGTLSDPRLAVYRAGVATPFAQNDNWGGAANIETARSNVGAFPVAADSRDALLLLTLEPGNYVAEAQAPANASGTVLVEVYEVP